MVCKPNQCDASGLTSVDVGGAEDGGFQIWVFCSGTIVNEVSTSTGPSLSRASWTCRCLHPPDIDVGGVEKCLLSLAHLVFPKATITVAIDAAQIR